MTAYQITDGFNCILVASLEEVELVKKEMRFGEFASGKKYDIQVTEVEVTEIPPDDLDYVRWLQE